MNTFNSCQPQSGLIHCGAAAWHSLRVVLSWVLSIILALLLVALVVSWQHNPGAFGAPLAGSAGGWRALLVAIAAVVLLAPLALLLLYGLFVCWLRRMLCPVFCPIAAALRQVMDFLGEMMAQIDNVSSGIGGVATQAEQVLTELGKVGIPDLPAMTRKLSDAVVLLPDLPFVPKVIEEGSMHANQRVNQLYGQFTNDVNQVMAKLNALALPLGLLSSGLASVRGFVGVVANALECFCGCCPDGKDDKKSKLALSAPALGTPGAAEPPTAQVG